MSYSRLLQFVQPRFKSEQAQPEPRLFLPITVNLRIFQVKVLHVIGWTIFHSVMPIKRCYRCLPILPDPLDVRGAHNEPPANADVSNEPPAACKAANWAGKRAYEFNQFHGNAPKRKSRRAKNVFI